jgi:tetratricopeptide (TPR) repeat protein
MTGLRTLGRLALIAGVFAGLSGCGNHKGDLGSQEETPVVHTPPPAEKSSTPDTSRAEIADIGNDGKVVAPQAEVTGKNAPAEMVSVQPTPVPTAPNPDRKPIKGDGEAVADNAAPAPATAPAAAKEGEKNGGEVKAEGDEKTPPPTPPAPPPPPAEETPEQKAARLLEEAKRLSGVKTQANLQEAEAAYQAGLKLFNDLEYEEAKKLFERAVTLDPAHEQARQKLQVVNSLLGIHVDKIARKIRELEAGERVKQQESLVQLANALQEARVLEERGSVLPPNPELVEKDRILADQLEALRHAQDKYKRVKEILNWMPPTFDLPQERETVNQGLTRIRQKIADKEDEINFLRRKQAQEEADKARIRETELFHARVAKLLEQIKDLYDQGQYKAAEKLAIQVLKIDPFNSDAEGWKSKARGAYHSREHADTADQLHDEYRNMIEDIDEQTISYAPLILYPRNWDQITRRAEASAIGKVAKEETWKADILRKLQKRVTFDFVDTSFDEAINFLRTVSQGVTIIVDPKVQAAGIPNLNLHVTEMSLDLALDWILKLAGLEKSLKDHAIYITTPEQNKEAVELRIYDIADLTQTIPDFPGPELQLQTADPAAQAAQGPAQGAFAPRPQAAPTAASLSDMIRQRVRPDQWDAALGTSIEEMAGRLVVMQRPEIHALIDQLLDNFRKTQRMMINIESRFLRIREANLESIGVEYQGLDTNVLFGDFGDLHNLGVGQGFVQPRVPGAGESIANPNIPFPGFTNGPHDALGGTLSEVGSVWNHNVAYANNQDITISAQDANGLMRQGGFNGQFTILNNTQLQAFMRALTIREDQSTLVSPRLTVFNTQRANMFVARQQSYVADYNINGDSYDPEVRQFLEGVVLDVRPIVSADRRYITIELRPTLTELVRFQTRQLDSFTVNAGAQVNIILQLSFPIQFPELAISRVRTTATVPDGGILLIAGLLRNVKFNAENGIPFVSDLPVVGRLFRWTNTENAKQNLSILISPRLILFNEEEEKL